MPLKLTGATTGSLTIDASDNGGDVIFSGDIGDLTGVDFTTSASSGDLLSYNGTNWVPVSASTPTSIQGTMTGSVIPDTDDTYDIGSATYKVRDLYLGSTSLHIGDVDVSSDQRLNWSYSELVLPNIQMAGHIIPDTNDAYDIGSASFKIRDLYVSDNSLWVGDSHKIDIDESDGKMKFRKRKKNKVPKKIIDEHTAKDVATHTADVLTQASKGSLNDVTLADWKTYANSLGGTLANSDIRDLYPNDVAYKDDYDEISSPSQQGREKLPPLTGGTVAHVHLKLGNTATVVTPSGDIDVAIHGALLGSPQGAFIEVIIHVMQGATTRTLNLSALTIDGVTVNSLTFANTPALQANKLSTFKINAVFIGEWRATVVGYPE